MENAISGMHQISDHIDKLCLPSVDIQEEIRLVLKNSFDAWIKSCPKDEMGRGMALYILNMDSESIWEQVQCRNRPVNRFIEQMSRKLYQAVPSMSDRMASNDVICKDDVAMEHCLNVEPSLHSSDETDTCDDDDSGGDDGTQQESEEDVDTQSESEHMNRWLDEMDEAETFREKKKNEEFDVDSDEDDSEDEETFVQRELYNSDSDCSPYEKDENNAGDLANAKYNEFFGSSKPLSYKKRLSASRTSANDAGEEYDIDGSPTHHETNYSRQKSIMQEQIALLEENAIGKKSWEVGGEIKSSQRPENSLLGISVDFERSSKITPVLDHEHLKSLEEMICQRIKDANFDNVMRMSANDRTEEKTGESVLNVSQERNKVGLGEIYAEEFLKQSANFDANAAKRKTETNDMITHFQKVCRQLDALSHFQYTPKPVGSTVDNTISVQSIALEDIAPITLSDVGSGSSAAQAPEQRVGKKRGLDAHFVDGENEITRNDRQRMRRKLKKKQTVSNGRKSLISDDHDLKIDARVTLDNVTEQNSKKIGYSKSSEYFSRMQTEASDNISRLKNSLLSSQSHQSCEQTAQSKLLKL